MLNFIIDKYLIINTLNKLWWRRFSYRTIAQGGSELICDRTVFEGNRSIRYRSFAHPLAMLPEPPRGFSFSRLQYRFAFSNDWTSELPDFWTSQIIGLLRSLPPLGGSSTKARGWGSLRLPHPLVEWLDFIISLPLGGCGITIRRSRYRGYWRCHPLTKRWHHQCCRISSYCQGQRLDRTKPWCSLSRWPCSVRQALHNYSFSLYSSNPQPY